MYEESGTEIVSVLDWEMAFLNQREVDVAYTAMLTECFKAGQQIEGVPSTEEMFAEYERLTGYRTGNHGYYRAYNLARLAIIFRLATRNMSPELRESTRPSWGWFEDRLLEAMGA
jgi:aminoglycoside phosphotransferase (APT) family kinase protein